MTNPQILKRLYSNYTKKYLSKIFIALILSIILAGSTSAIAYLLDPAIDKIFLNKEPHFNNSIFHNNRFCIKGFISLWG